VASPAFALDFERPLLELERKIDELKALAGSSDFSAEIQKLEKKARRLQSEIFSDLSRWQVTQLSRHPQRPYFLDYVQLLFTDFFELAGDRSYAEDPSIVGGWARLDGRPVMLLGHQKGRNTKENMLRNFGMPRPEGYRKARRLMELAERFSRPILTFVDTPGAYPGIGAEERGQAEAIAANLEVMRLGRRAGHRRRQPGADAGEQHLLGHQPRVLLQHPLPRHHEGGEGGGRAQAHRAGPPRAQGRR